jgi:hypothetical protein
VTISELIFYLRKCDIQGCDARAVRFWREKKVCADCAGCIDAVRIANDCAPVDWQLEPVE